MHQGSASLAGAAVLIHPALGASFQPVFVTTTLPMPLQHFGVNVCPYVHKVNRYDHRRAVYKEYMGILKKFGYRGLVARRPAGCAEGEGLTGDTSMLSNARHAINSATYQGDLT